MPFSPSPLQLLESRRGLHGLARYLLGVVQFCDDQCRNRYRTSADQAFLLTYRSSSYQNHQDHLSRVKGGLVIARVYVAGPYTQGDVAVNVRRAYEVANRLADLGFAPFVPHATHFWHLLFPRRYEFWLALDREFLPCCQALFRIEGPSIGADQEEALARQLRIPVFHDTEELVRHFASTRDKKGVS